MKRDNINYLVVGMFVLSMLAVLLVLLYKLTGGTEANDIYYVRLDNVAGLVSGTPVTYEGYVIGNVDDIAPDQTLHGTDYNIRLRIKDRWMIATDSVARIYSAGLLSDTVVDIKEGSSSSYLVPGDQINGIQSEDIFSVMGSVTSDFGDLSRTTIRPLLESLKNTVDLVGGEFEASLPMLFKDTKQLMISLNEGVSRLQNILSKTNEQKIISIVRNIENSTENFYDLSSSLKNTQQKINDVVTSANVAINSNTPHINQSLKSLQYSLDTIAKYVDEVLLNLEDTSHNMNEFSRNIRRSPGLLLRGGAPQEGEFND